MPAGMTAAAAEFLRSYSADARVRWTPEDLKAQGEFVNRGVAGQTFLDWSSPAAALALVQSSMAHTVIGEAGKYEVIVLAGPVVELLEPAVLFSQAAIPLVPGGRLIGVMPCLRDNSPESQEFMRHAAAALWPYYTAEELLEVLRETGWHVEAGSTVFVPIPRFLRAVLEDQLGFKGFSRIFGQLRADGYDPMEVGWGELRFVAALGLQDD